VIWAKTDAGRTEIQARALVKERAQRNLLLVIDGVKTDETLLASLAGITIDDFAALQSLGLIAPVGAPATGGSAAAPAAEPAAALDHGQFTAALTQMISKELGLRAFVLTLAVEKAGTIEELQAVAERTLAQIAERKGEAAAAAARRTLYGG
jgi:hypothetical protein